MIANALPGDGGSQSQNGALGSVTPKQLNTEMTNPASTTKCEVEAGNDWLLPMGLLLVDGWGASCHHLIPSRQFMA